MFSRSHAFLHTFDRYVSVCAHLTDRATSISFSDVMSPGNKDSNPHAGIEIGQGSSAYVSKWMALHGNATHIVGTGIVVNADLGGKVVRTLALPASEPGGELQTYCTAGRSACPPMASCQGDTGCSLKEQGASLDYGSFNDAASTAAFGCDLTGDGLASSLPPAGESGSDGGGRCTAPSENIASQLSTIEGWGSEWSGKFPPFAYNMNTACPCQAP